MSVRFGPARSGFIPWTAGSLTKHLVNCLAPVDLEVARRSSAE
jgi:hypothetical protein